MKKYAIVFLILSVLLISACAPKVNPKMDEFAKCLTENDVKMFGAYWCPHCKNTKDSFGESWQYVDYVECSLPGGNGQTEVCANEGIESYPTWSFEDGRRLSGEIPLQQLSALSGCEFPI